MNSLASLAHHPPPLNASQIAFFATAATVIPVLYLALAVQGRAYGTLIQIANRAEQEVAVRARVRGKKRWGLGLTGNIAVNLATLILLYAGTGEFQALDALYTGSGDSNGQYVLFATTFLLILVVGGPVITLGLRVWGPKAVKDVLNQDQEEPTPTPQHPGSGQAAPTSILEPGKTDKAQAGAGEDALTHEGIGTENGPTVPESLDNS
jgi:hypothetical protein